MPAILVLLACIILVALGVSYLMSNAIRGQGKVTYFTTIKVPHPHSTHAAAFLWRPHGSHNRVTARLASPENRAVPHAYVQCRAAARVKRVGRETVPLLSACGLASRAST